MKKINEMNKAELVEYATSLEEMTQRLNEAVDNLTHQVNELQLKLEASSKDGRKSQVLEILRKHGAISIVNIAKLLNISTKNVSSQLTYLRSDGYAIFTDPNGKKLLVEKTTTESNSVDEAKPQNETK